MQDRVKSRPVKKPRMSGSRRKSTAVKPASRGFAAESNHNGFTAEAQTLDYSQVVERVRKLVNQRLPEGAIVAVVNKGDPHLIEFSGRLGWHFPRNEQGAWAGFHPADSNAAIAYLEEARAGGAKYFLLPQTFIWWLEHYAAFKRYLDESYRLVSSGDYGVLYELTSTEKNKLNQVSTRVDYLLGVLYPLLDQLRQKADVPENKNHEWAEAIQHRLAEIEQSLQQRAGANTDDSQRLELLAENLSTLAITLGELHEKLHATASADVTSLLDQRLKEQEEYFSAQLERRLIEQRQEHDRHLQDQHVVMLRLLEDQQRLYQQNFRELDEKLSAQLRETNQSLEKQDQQHADLNALITQKVVDLEALIADHCDQRFAELSDITRQKIADSEKRTTQNASALVEAVADLLNGEAKRISEIKTQMTSLMAQVEKRPEPKSKTPPPAETDEQTSHQRRFNLSMMQAMDSIAAHLRALDAQMNLLNNRVNAQQPPTPPIQEKHEGGV